MSVHRGLERLGIAASAVALTLTLGCNGTVGDPPGPCQTTHQLLDFLTVRAATFPQPVLPGTLFEIEGDSFMVSQSCVTPEIVLVGGTGGGQAEVALRAEILSTNEAEAVLEPAAAASLGTGGTFNGELQVRFRAVQGDRVYRASLPMTFDLASTLPPTIASVTPSGDVYLNDVLTVTGSGFLGGEEGTTEIVVSGTYTPETGSPRTVEGVRLPGTLVDPRDRSRTTFLWSPQLSGLRPGSFEGTVLVENAHASGERVAGGTTSISLQQRTTFLVGASPTVAAIGQIVDVTGRGFIGPPDGTTSFRLDGTFDPADEPAHEVVGRELIGVFESGTSVHYPITVSAEGQYLHAVDFGYHRGVFQGTATPILTMGVERFEGIPTPFSFSLGPVKQIVWVRFLPGFSESVELFGLGAVEEEVRAAIIDKMLRIYCPPDEPARCINVELRTEEPVDFYDGGYAVLDIGGRDPNNMGLFGYDNTPGKDVGNLRLHDHVGGENAMGALDGYGYGGVFVESYLFWSEHPPFERPPAAPPPEPLFDYVFDPVREHEVVAGEYPTGASPERISVIAEAIRVLGNIVGDTAAHEFGHSLGLANPYGSPTDYHSLVPGEGCLMDAGGDRPFLERAEMLGNTGAHFCGDDFYYLREILPVD